MPTVDWQRTIEQHNHTVVVSLLARGVRLKRARELAHESWALLYEKHRAGLLPIVQLPGLAVRQASFLALQQQAPREAPLDEAPQALELADDAPAVDVVLDLRQQLATASAALGECGPRAQALFDVAMRYPDEPHAALAQRVGVSVQRFRQTLCEVRARLRAALSAGGEP